MFVCRQLFGISPYFGSDFSPISNSFHPICLAIGNCKEPDMQSFIGEAGACHLIDGNGSSVANQVDPPTASRDLQMMSLAGISAPSTPTIRSMAGGSVSPSVTGVDQPQFHACIIGSRTLTVPKELSGNVYSTSLLLLANLFDQCHLLLIVACLSATIQHLGRELTSDF